MFFKGMDFRWLRTLIDSFPFSLENQGNSDARFGCNLQSAVDSKMI